MLYQLPRPGSPEESWLRPYAKSLDLRERLLERVEICRVDWRVDELETSLLDHLFDPLLCRLLGIHRHDLLATAQRGNQNSLHRSLENLVGGPALYGQRRPHTFEGLILESSVVLGPRLRGTEHDAHCPLVERGVHRRTRSVRAHSVHKHQPPCVKSFRDHRLPGGFQPQGPLHRPYNPFFG